jgi:hypothetical protein
VSYEDELEKLKSVAFEMGWYARAMEQAKADTDPAHVIELRNPYGASALVEHVDGEDG